MPRSYAVRMRRLRLLVLMLVIPAAASAQTSGPKKEPSPYDRIWGDFTQWYADDANPVIQRLALSGRLHYEFASVESDQGDHSEWNLRRLRIGPRITLFRKFTLHGEVELDPQRHDPLYVRFTDLYVQWSKTPQLAVTVGKQSVPFTIDGATSSRELLTIDRSNLTNNIWFPQEYLPGVSVSGRTAPWMYRLGVYSAGTANKEFGEFDGGTATLAVVGYDFAKALGTREALLAANYVHQNENPNNTFTRQLQNILSVNFKLDTERWGVRSDVSTATGYLRQSDLWGVMAMPYFNVTDKLQLVGRYTFLASDDPNGVQLATYENRVVAGRGDEYNEMYVGANYYFYGHRLKLQTGVQVADMNDRADDGGAYSGVSWTSGIRVGW